MRHRTRRFLTDTRAMVVQLEIYAPRGELKVMDVCETDEQLNKMTVMNLKGKVGKELAIVGDTRLVHKTQTLEETSQLADYGIKHMSKIHTLLLLPGGCKEDEP